MNRRIKTVKGTIVAIAIICLTSTIGSIYARYSGFTVNHTMMDSISKIKTMIISSSTKNGGSK
ncbi:MAG: hypothetical protein IKF17_02360 [Clostridia bacterium]|nr:hypothetical protein [Clostridia bacterium]